MSHGGRGVLAELKAEGAELTDGPNEQPYGIDFGGRDPFGSQDQLM